MTIRAGLMSAAAMAVMAASAASAAETAPTPAVAAPPAADMPITCGSPIAWDATEESLKAQFGAENVVHKDLGGPEGTEMFGTQIYSKDAKKTFDVVWSDETKWANPVVINVNQVWSEDGETMTRPEWVSAEGIKLGMPIEDLEKINGKPFKLFGFGWDYGGQVSSWEGGKLEPAADATCGVSVVMTDTAADGTPPGVMGDGEIMSNDKDMPAAKAQVGRFTIYYVRPDAETSAPPTP